MEVLNFAMYPYIPDLNDDSFQSLKKMIKTRFERECAAEGLDVALSFVDSLQYAYDVDKIALKFTHNCIDVMEVDAILLGEITDQNILLPVASAYPGFTSTDYFPAAREAVTYNGTVYGVPTLQCGNFLIELADDKNTDTFLPVGEIRNMSDMEDALSGISGPGSDNSAVLLGNFRGSWTLPLFYVESYIFKYKNKRPEEAYEKQPFEPDEAVLGDLRTFSGFALEADGSNKATNKYYKTCPGDMTERMVQSNQSLSTSYSETMGETLYRSMEAGSTKHVINVNSRNKLLTYTDALVINKQISRSKKRIVEKFLKFYSGLKMRTMIAMGKDLDVVAPRYVLPARMDFYRSRHANKVYRKFFKVLKKYSVSAPNYGIYDRLSEMQDTLQMDLCYCGAVETCPEHHCQSD